MTPSLLGSCTCVTNFYNSAILPLVTCDACANTCSTCEGGSNLQCITWVDPNATADTSTATSNECIWNPAYWNSATIATNVTCDSWHATWATCRAGGVNDWDTCADSNATITSPGTCLCDTGFYDSDSSDVMNCTACDATCATCSVGGTANDWDSCLDSNASLTSVPGQCFCNSSYVDSNTGAGMICNPCHLSWATCSDATASGCDTCADRLATIATTPGPCTWPDQYFDSQNGDLMQWDRCHLNCKTCAQSGADKWLSWIDSNASINEVTGDHCTWNDPYYDINAGIEPQ